MQAGSSLQRLGCQKCAFSEWSFGDFLLLKRNYVNETLSAKMFSVRMAEKDLKSFLVGLNHGESIVYRLYLYPLIG